MSVRNYIWFALGFFKTYFSVFFFQSFFETFSDIYLTPNNKETAAMLRFLEFLEYFELQSFNMQPNWFEGYNHPYNVGSASTNNGNESQNALIA